MGRFSRGGGGRRELAQRLFTPLPARYDRLAEWLSFGQNGRWRKAMVDKALEGSPALVCDVATGTAGVALQLASRDGARVVGVDVTEAMLRRAKQNVSGAGADERVSLAVGDAVQLPFASSTFDALTFTYLLRYVEDPGATLAELARVVRPGGVVASLEFLRPENSLWRVSWWVYTRVVLPVAGWLSGGREWYEVGRFLGPSISGHYDRYPVSWTVEAWRSAGLDQVQVRRMSLGGGLVMWGRRAGG
ncbi:MAG TPA: class I SAM-dependent methyltransferase [Acidimicrobiales bacterium]|nr:class I SAM-dependent methyltransferase [Acidimicrobiales bacterium]